MGALVGVKPPCVTHRPGRRGGVAPAVEPVTGLACLQSREAVPLDLPPLAVLSFHGSSGSRRGGSNARACQFL